MRAWWLAALAACSGEAGTLQLELATTPGSSLLSGADRIRLTLTNPTEVRESTRDEDGIDLAFEIEATTTPRTLIVEAFDASDALLAAGQSPRFALSGEDQRVVVFVAPPYSIQEAPERMPPARSRVAGTPIVFGAVFAGGFDAQGAPGDELAIYNAFDHSIVYGIAMPVPRGDVTLAANAAGNVYVFGGTAADATPQGAFHLFQTQVPPAGAFLDLGERPDLARTGARAYALGIDTFLVSGEPALTMSGSMLVPRDEPARMPAIGTEVVVDATRYAVGLDADRVIVASLDGASEIVLPAPITGGGIAARPDGSVLVLDGARGGYILDIVAGTVERRDELFELAHASPVVAATARHVVVASAGMAEVLDATTLAHLATVPVATRTGAIAIPLPTDQILFAGGDAATDLVELFTPPVP